jgi:RimJ/RimL family protein N-acetyltransferase
VSESPPKVFAATELRTKRCILRPWLARDAGALPAIANDRAIARNTSNRFPHPFEAADARRFVARHRRNQGIDSWQFAVLLGDTLIGGCGATRGRDVQSHTAEVGYWLGVDHWGMGLATEVVAGLAEYLRNATDLEQLTATGFAWNAPSVRVLEKTGFVLEGVRRGVVKKWGERTDLWIYGMLLR